MLSPSQQKAYDAANNGDNIFITAPAGRGKSFLTRALTTPSTIVVAPTGIAALNVQGVTCHKAFGLPIGLVQSKDKYIIPKSMEIFRSHAIKRIIFSEIGMVRTDQFDLINSRLQAIKGNRKPFGGIQVVAEGDLCQLSPIVSKIEQEAFYKQYDSAFCFTSKHWNFTTHELLESHRHSNPEHASLLDRLRMGDKSVVSEIVKISKPYDPTDESITLCAYKDSAKQINTTHYNKISSSEKVYHCTMRGAPNKGEKPVEEVLQLKVGCRVLIKANDVNGSYVNGDRGTITAMHNNTVDVLLDRGGEVTVERFTWTDYRYTTNNGRLTKEPAGTFSQLPITLGWASTIHACQGITLDSAAIDIGRGCFSHGQLYTSISRVRDLTKQSFVRLPTTSDLIMSDEVKEFYAR